MRIDFSQLDKEDVDNSPEKILIDNKLQTFWGKPQEDNALSRIQQESPSVNFSVSYPYEVSRSLSPEGINKEISYLKAKQILPTSTLNYIHSNIHKSLESSF